MVWGAAALVFLMDAAVLWACCVVAGWDDERWGRNDGDTYHPGVRDSAGPVVDRRPAVTTDGQVSLFPEVCYWIPREDNGTRMWECPVCGKRMTGQPLGWYQYNYYKYCPYCGTRLMTKASLVDPGGLP